MTESATSPESPSRPRRVRRILLLLGVPALVGAVALGVYLAGGGAVDTEDAYVKAEMAPISAEVEGRVVDVAVTDNQSVAAGQVLFRLDPAPFEVAVARAEAQLAQARTDLAATRAAYREKQAEIGVAQTRAHFADRDQARQADLAARHFISGARLDDAQRDADLARQQVGALRDDLSRLAASLNGGPAVADAEQPAVRAAEAALAQAKLDLDHATVRAPSAGTVRTPPKRGQYLKAGQTALALVADQAPWVEANFTETDLTHVRVGQTAEVRVDTWPGQVWRGRVESVAPATGAEFSLIPAQNASGNWVKVVQRVPVRIALEPVAGAPLRAGLSATVEVLTGQRHSLFGLTL